MILHRRDAIERFGGVADHASVGGDERDTRAEQFTESIRLLVAFGDATIGPPRASRSAAIRASATSVSSIRSSICRRIVVANSAPATASAISVEASAATKNFAWNVARNGSGIGDQAGGGGSASL